MFMKKTILHKITIHKSTFMVQNVRHLFKKTSIYTRCTIRQLILIHRLTMTLLSMKSNKFFNADPFYYDDNLRMSYQVVLFEMQQLNIIQSNNVNWLYTVISWVWLVQPCDKLSAQLPVPIRMHFRTARKNKSHDQWRQNEMNIASHDQLKWTIEKNIEKYIDFWGRRCAKGIRQLLEWTHNSWTGNLSTRWMDGWDLTAF